MPLTYLPDISRPDISCPPRDLTVKVLVCLYSWLWNALCIAGTGGLWTLYLFPALFYPYCRTRVLPIAAAITFGELYEDSLGYKKGYK